MSNQRNIRDAIRQMAGVNGIDYIRIIDATVKSVSKRDRTCNVKAINTGADIDINDVLLSVQPNDGLILIPKVDSLVKIAVCEKNEPYVISFSDIDEMRVTIDGMEVLIKGNEVLLGDGSFSGLVKVGSLVTEYNNRLNALKGAIAAGFGALSGIDSGASLAAFNSAAAGVLPMVQQTLENNKIKHGI